MTNEVAKAEDYSKQKAIVDTVRNSIFPKATDAQLMLFFHKCQTMGVHPLDGMIHPSVYRGSTGEPDKVVFVTSIDVLRSRSSENDNGMDEPEFGPMIDQETEAVTMQAPEWARVKVYKKGVDRPYVGVARWKEYYPGEKRGHQYRQKPYLMLAKCAEALARRIAFPKELDKLYTPEEMEATTAMLAGVTVKSAKPSVNPSDVTDLTEPQNPKDYIMPTGDERKAGKLVSEKQGWLMVGTCKKGNISDQAVANAAKVKNVFWLTWAKDSKVNFNVMLQTVKDKPNAFAKYDPAAIAAKKAAETKPEAPAEASSVMGADEFEAIVSTFQLQAGLSEEDLNKKLDAEFGIQGGVKNIPAEMQSKVVDYLTSLTEHE